MQEVQFVSDLVINFIEGVIDFNPAKIKKYYKSYDEMFDQEEDLEKRFEAVFQRLVTLPVADFSDTVFRSAQIAFSLMVVLDQRRDAMPSVEKIHDVIRSTDAQVSAASDEPGSVDVGYLTGFTGGNLHRIRSRTIRHDLLNEAFA